MEHDLAGYHFNQLKTGQIFKQLRQATGMSIKSAAKKTGLTGDTIENIERGLVQGIKHESFFKLCVAYSTSMEAVTLLMLTGDNIGFRDQIMLYQPKEDSVIPADVLDSVPSVVPDTAVAAAEAVAAAKNPPAPTQNTRTTEEYIAFLQSHVERLTALLDKAMTKG